MSLDLQTLRIAFLTGSLSLALAGALLLGRQLKQHPELLRWFLGLALLSLATAGSVFTGPERGVAMIVFNNLTGVLSFGLMLDAVMRLGGQRIGAIGLWLPACAIAIAQALQPQDAGSRVMLMSFVIAAQLFGCAVFSLLPNPEVSLRSRIVLGAGFLLGCFAFGLRAWLVAASALSFQPQTLPAGNPVFVLLAYTSVLLTSVVFVFVQLERDHNAGRRLATLDILTGAYNRRTLLELGQRELASAQRRGRSLAVLMVDVDGLRAINDRRGAYFGDKVLIHLTELLTSSLQRQDLFGRVGGEEFCAVLPDTTLDGALHVAERLRARIEIASERECGTDYRVSIGVCERALNELSFEHCLARAEAAMEIARRTGNRVEIDSGSTAGRAVITGSE